MPREQYQAKLEGLRDNVLYMSELVAERLRMGLDALEQQDAELGEEVITGDAESYQYLVESIRQHPDQETLREMFTDAGFDRARYTNLTGGIVALHEGFKL